MKSIVSYKNRGIGGNSSYRGNCSPKLTQDLIKQFNGKLISDLGDILCDRINYTYYLQMKGVLQWQKKLKNVV
jgi:hypothetical protein